MPSPDRLYAISGATFLAVAMTTLVSAMQAQKVPPGDRRPTVAVDFIAVQAEGAPVEGLQPADVEIRVDGRIRQVRSLRPTFPGGVKATSSASPRIPAPYGTNVGVAAGRVFALVVDQDSFIAGHEQLLRHAVEGLTRQLSPVDRVMMVALPFGGVMLAPTSDTARIRQAMDGLSVQGSRSETGSELACRTRRFLEALDGFLQAQAGRESPLTVILFTAGLAGPRRDAPMALAPGMCELVVQDFRRVTASAGAARADFYLAHPDDIAVAATRWTENIAGVGSLGSDNPLEGIEHLAGSTGGVRLPLAATGTGALDRVARESSAAFIAELESEDREVFGRGRVLAIRALRQGVTVRARPIVVLKEPPQATSARHSLAELLVSAESEPDVPIRAAGFTVREPNGRLRVGVVVEPADAASLLESAGAILVGSDGKVAARWIAADTGGRPLVGAMAVPPGTYRLRVAVIDSAGRTGTAEDLVEARLAQVGPLSLGSLLLSASKPEGLVPRLEFGAEPTAIASFDIYGGTETTRLSARLEMARSTDGPPLVAVPVVLSRADAGRVMATGSAPIGALPPGDYVVRGIIQLEDGTIGTVVRTLRKAGAK